MMYSHKGQAPAPLPFRIVMPDGMTRTDPETFTVDEIALAGYVEAPDVPVFDALTHEARWVNGAGWEIVALPEPPPVVPGTVLSHADVLSLVTPEEWAEMNKFHPQAAGTSPSGTPYADAQVFWGVSVFNKAAHVDLADPRAQAIFGLLTHKGIIAPSRAEELQAAMAAVASKRP